MKAYQRQIRERKALELPRESHANCKDYSVAPVDLPTASQFILEYEWLGTMPSVPRQCYGLFHVNEVEPCGIVVFGNGGGSEARKLCGESWTLKAIALERGACAHWVHEHAPSWFVSHAVKQAYRDHGWQVFYAYSDIEAGEVGTIYQACNWIYIGQGNGRGAGLTWRYQYFYDGETLSSRTFRRRKKRDGVMSQPWSYFVERGWTRKRHFDKHRYVKFEGSKRQVRQMRQALRYPELPYIKRADLKV